MLGRDVCTKARPRSRPPTTALASAGRLVDWTIDSACPLQAERRGFYGQIRQEGVEERGIGHAAAEARHVEERALGPQCKEPEAGDRDRPQRGTGERGEGPA